MNIVPRIPITTAMITSSSVTDVADYDESNSYSAGNMVKDPTTFVQYESQIGSNLGNDPTTDDGTYWLAVGYPNSRRMFDGALGANATYGKTEKATSIVVVLEIDTLFTSVGVFGVEGASVTLEIVEDSQTIYDETVSMVRTDDVENVWDYMFTEPEYKTAYVFASVPGFSGTIVTLTISAPGSTARIGEAIFGYGRKIGETLAGSGPLIKDYSIKEANDFGEYTIVERAYSRGANMVVGINPQDTDRITRILEENRATICLFYPDSDMEHYGLTVVGFYRSFEPGLIHRGIVPVTIPIEGIT